MDTIGEICSVHRRRHPLKNHNIELFSDYFAQETNIFTRADARIKLFFVLLTLALSLLTGNIAILFLITLLCICMLLMVKIPTRIIIVRLSGPLAIVAVILVLQGILFGKTPLYSFDLIGLNMTIYKEGIGRGLLIAGRVIAGTSLLLFLGMTTPVDRLLGALKFFKIPDGWLEILSFTYRYIFVFVDEAQSIMDAQRLRLGYKGIRVGLRSWGILTGSLFTRVFDQASATYDAMTLRGYNGEIYIKRPGRFTAVDMRAGFSMAVIYLFLLFTAIRWG